ncbi:hypothetical protein [Streptomyces sp. KL116D]|uniref:hypothetical protein n=1 Tax=Streptomyces sp. KL116D TaxID=3045152 RepID=UPI003558E1EC
MTKNLPRLIPTGKCFCGCGAEVGLGSFFARGHDKVAESALIAVEYGGSVAQMLHAKGFGPSHSVVHKAIEDASWEKCERCSYIGAPASMRNHEKKSHEKED